MHLKNSCYLRNGSFVLQRVGAYFLKVMHYSIQDQKSADQDLTLFSDFENLVPLRSNKIFFRVISEKSYCKQGRIHGPRRCAGRFLFVDISLAPAPYGSLQF